MNRRRTILPTAAAIAALATVGLAASALSHSLSVGAGAGSLQADQSLPYRYVGSPPAWLTTAIGSSASHWNNKAVNNSRVATVAYSSSGTATVEYSDADVSPCGSGSLAWMQCAEDGGTTAWKIYIRNLTASPNGNTKWWNQTASCPGGTIYCYYVERGLIHEFGHAILTLSHPDPARSESDTVMNASLPTWGAAGWNSFDLKPCDVAASQKVWDLKSLPGLYADCYDHITDHGVVGLKTAVTWPGGSSFAGCVGFSTTVSGRLQVGDYAGYGSKLKTNPLQGRRVWVDRGATAKIASAIASASPGVNWTATIPSSSAGTVAYEAYFDVSADPGLDSAPHVPFTIVRSNQC